jgi:hypothetical protein
MSIVFAKSVSGVYLKAPRDSSSHRGVPSTRVDKSADEIDFATQRNGRPASDLHV